MKKNHLFILYLMAAASLIFSCNKNNLPVEGEAQPIAEAESAQNGMLVVTVAPDNGATKADGNSTTETSESVISSLQVFVFYGTTNDSLGQTANSLETDAYELFDGTENNRAMTLTTTVGQKYIYALANAPRLRNVTNIDDLKSRVMSLGNNYLTLTTVGTEQRRGLVMAGAFGYTSGDAAINIVGTKKDIGAYSQNNNASMTTVPVSLYRLAARIELDNLKVDFRNTNLEGKEFVLKEIYLKNVPNSVRVSGQNADLLGSDATYWTNRITPEASPKDKSGLDVTSLIYEQRASGGTTCNNAGAETTIKSYFYSYPNPITEDATGDTWSQRRTRLVIHATIGGEDSYYPISIADPRNFVTDGSSTPSSSATHSCIVGNHKYVISKISITSKGYPNDDHDDPIVTGRAHVEVSVQEWNGTTVTNYEI